MDSSPQLPLQPLTSPQTYSQNQGIAISQVPTTSPEPVTTSELTGSNLVESNYQTLAPASPHFQTIVWEVKILHTIRWTVTAGLTLEGFKGLYDSLYFIFVEFKHFEAALVMHELTEAQINVLVAKVAIMLFSTAMSLFFALQLALFHRHRIMKWLKILGGIIVFVVSALTMMYANQIPADALLNQLPIFQFP